MRLLTIDHELGPIEESERLARTWSPDDVTRNETPITKYEDGRMVQEVNFGNKVKLVAGDKAIQPSPTPNTSSAPKRQRRK